MDTKPTDAVAPPVVPEAEAAVPVPLLRRRGWRAFRADPAGLALATLFALQAMTPSLMPRSWVFQAVASGLSGAIGYGIGALVWSLLRRIPAYQRLADRARARIPERARRRIWLALLAAVPTSLVLVLVVASDWQRETRVLVGLPPETSSGWLRAAPVIIAIVAVVVALFRLLRLAARWIAALLRRWTGLPRGVAQAVGLAIVGVLAFGLFDKVLLGWELSAADAAFSLANSQTLPGVHQPVSPERSGSPTSLSPWSTLGVYGQQFVAGGPSRARMAKAAGIPEASVKQPIRVYVGLGAGSTPARRAQLAVSELERTGAFARAVICVATSTGTGWIDSAAPKSLELMYGGNTAFVTTQYSYLPSWIGFLFDRARADAEGRALFDAVYTRVHQLPANHRPKLVVYGLSLGSAGSEGAFSSLGDVRERTDGALWAGPTNNNKLWSVLVARRDPGTTEAAPVYADGLVARFGDRTSDLLTPDRPWLRPRVAYLMHPTDPVMWWSPHLLFDRPDWLAEPRGRGVPPSMRWYPVVTFWQVTVDLANAAYPPQGFGHNYGAQMLDAWALVLPPSGWTAADTARARAVFLQ
ncbi:MAG: alpha/beta hydrolase [Blastococcus sp.]